jgi:hypothetical protein
LQKTEKVKKTSSHTTATIFKQCNDELSPFLSTIVIILSILLLFHGFLPSLLTEDVEALEGVDGEDFERILEEPHGKAVHPHVKWHHLGLHASLL